MASTSPTYSRHVASTARRRRIAPTAVIALALGGCGGAERSTAAFCESARTQLDDLEQKYRSRTQAVEESDPLTGLVVGIASLVEGQGDIAVFFRKLAEVAPEQIRVDTEAVADGMQQQADRAADMASDPLGGLVGTLVGGLQLQGPYARVAEFARTNCGLDF